MLCNSSDTKDREDYERDSFRVMFTAVDWNLTERGYKRLIIFDRDFKSLKQILGEKAYLLRQQERQRQAAELVDPDTKFIINRADWSQIALEIKWLLRLIT